ncbi:hypothetical protein JZ751_013439, partial [Albula glossodonta]
MKAALALPAPAVKQSDLGLPVSLPMDCGETRLICPGIPPHGLWRDQGSMARLHQWPGQFLLGPSLLLLPRGTHVMDRPGSVRRDGAPPRRCAQLSLLGWGAEGGEVSHQEAVILCTASQTGPDYGVLKNSVEYVSTAALCWAKGKYEDHTETLKCFLSIGEKGQIPVYISTVDMRDWIISKAQSIPRERFSSFYFDLQPVVERAVREIIEELAQPPTSRLQTVAEVVMDTVADLSCALLEGGEELSVRLLSDMAVAVTVSVLQELEGVEQCEVQCWRQVRPRLVGALCGELLETVSPKDLQRALRGKWDAESRAVTAAIITSVTAAVNSVLAQPDATPGSSLETAVDADEEAKDVETML